MVPENRARRLQTIDGSHNECTLSSVISKLWNKHIPDLLSDWSRQIGILNVSHLDIQIIQIIQSKINSH
jgi:hypothetical protein